MIELPVSLYIHYPWCVKKCPYCDFNSHTAQDYDHQKDYVDCLIADFREEISTLGPVSIQTIFIGGGTPSLMTAKSLSRLLAAINTLCPIALDTEITMEANPGTVDESRFEAFVGAGVNRLSIGVQSFSNTQLSALGRIHSGEDAIRAFEAARKAGISNINLDLMHGLPGQTLSSAMDDLRTATSLQPEHLSWYQLTIEPNTAFYSSPPELPDEETLWQIYSQGEDYLETHGFRRYEVSAFCREGYECKHNLNYWRFGDYIGIGAGAHGKLRGLRTSKTRVPKDYVESQKRKTTKIDEPRLEFLLNSLRLVDGFTLNDFNRTTGLPVSNLEDFVRKAVEKGLLESDESIRPTKLGMRYLNDLLMMVD